jgi:hypothetical protein
VRWEELGESGQEGDLKGGGASDGRQTDHRSRQ